MTRATSVATLRLPFSNVHLVLGERPILVDAGAPKDAEAIAAWLERRGIDPAALALIVLTHAHGDHAGSAAELRRRFGVPLAIGGPDQERASAGRNGPLRALGVEARLLRPFVDLRWEPFVADVVVDGTVDLAGYGVAGRVRLAPAHTPGSLVVELQGEALVGDLLRGGWMGGRLAPRRPHRHYYMDEPAAASGIADDLARSGATRLHVGHGGSLDIGSARRALAG